MTNVNNIYWTSVVFCVNVAETKAADIVKLIIESGCSEVGYSYTLGEHDDLPDTKLAFVLVQN